MRIPEPPPWVFWGIVVLALMCLIGGLPSCSFPLRFDPHRQDLEWRQKQCEQKGGNPQECRP